MHMEAGSQAVLRPIAAGCDLATFPGTEEQFYFEHAVSNHAMHCTGLTVSALRLNS